MLPLDSIQLVLTLGDPLCQAMTSARFLVVDAPSAYNMLLGRPSLNAIKAIPSAYHMMIKFPTTSRVGMVQGDQRVARECYSASMKQKTVDNIYLVRSRRHLAVTTSDPRDAKDKSRPNKSLCDVAETTEVATKNQGRDINNQMGQLI